MNILFYCPFKFNIKSNNIRSLGGIESLNYILAKYLSKSKNTIYLATNCKKLVKQQNLINIPIHKLLNNLSKYKFDKVISSNDPTIFNHIKDSQKFLWLHNKLPIEKAIRKKKLFSILRNRIYSVFVSNFLLNKTSNIFNFEKKFVVPNFLDPAFSINKPKFNRKPHFVWSVQRQKGLFEILNLWKKKIYIKNNQAKLFIFGINKKDLDKNHVKHLSKYNIIFKGRVSKKELIKQYNSSMGMICLGYDETFCINAIESFACGLPLITFGFTALSELTNNKNSFIMNNFNDFEKTIFKILNMNSSKRHQSINYCFNFSKKYHIKKIIPAWKKILNF
jgi:glycosyltransferase involved in cell wall biosynthesis